MKLIFLSESGRQSYTVNTRRVSVKLVLMGLLLGTIGIGALIASLGANVREGAVVRADDQELRHALHLQRDAFQQAQKNVDHEITALTVRVARLQAQLARLDALGARVSQVAKLEKGEFDFSSLPAVGGPEFDVRSGDKGIPNVYQLLNKMEALVEDREGQLSVLDDHLSARAINRDAFLAGRPIKSGWMSSKFGRRADPFTGKQAWHGGVDFAGKSGGDVIVVAAGVVTHAGSRYGYGEMVEVNHGNGFVTRYAHNRENLVAAGDVVKKGATIAKMGSTGRSTGPHVHFEVRKNGKSVDPERYVYRRERG